MMEKTNSVTLDNTENAVSRREGERNKKHSQAVNGLREN